MNQNMNPVDSGTVTISSYPNSPSSDSGLPGEVTPPTPPVDSGSASKVNPLSSVTSASFVTPELQSAKINDVASSRSAAADPWASMSKVVDALVVVVNSLVSLVTNVMNSFRGIAPAVPSSTGASPLVATQQRGALEVTKSDAGMIAVRTLDGFTVRAEGRDQAWSITGPDGRATRIWGDPHVTESDGDKWDFINRATFMFGRNKATVEVVPAGNGQTLSARVTVYSDHERVTIDGIDKDQPSIISASTDGLQHDAALADGEIYKRAVTTNGEAWVSKATGKVVPVKR
jgi:hypothetical protein